MRLNFDYNDPLIAAIREETRFINLMDDGYAQIFFYDNTRDTQIILRTIMNKPDLEVKSVEIQKRFFGPDSSHSVVFDVYAVDSDGTQYDIEIQNDSEGASPYRAAFNSAMLTVNTLMKREHHTELARRERVVIFITLHDVLKGNLPVYTIKRKCIETGRIFEDGASIIYVNTAHKDYTTAIGKLIHDFRCRKPEELYSQEFAETTSRIYKDKGGKYMKSLDAFEARITATTEARVTAMAEARVSKNIALELLKLGQNALEDIARICHMSLEQVQELAASIKA